MKNKKETEQLVTEAVQGSKDALEEIVRRIQGPVYSLAVRMLLHPSDAQEATQEILITVITNLRGYRFEGPFRAWVMRIAANKLKAVRKTFLEKHCGLFDDSNRCRCKSILAAHLEKGWINPDKPVFVSNPDNVRSPTTLKHYLKELDELERISAIYKSLPSSDFDFVGFLRNLNNNDQYRLISDPQIR